MYVRKRGRKHCAFVREWLKEWITAGGRLSKAWPLEELMDDYKRFHGFSDDSLDLVYFRECIRLTSMEMGYKFRRCNILGEHWICIFEDNIGGAFAALFSRREIVDGPRVKGMPMTNPNSLYPANGAESPREGHKPVTARNSTGAYGSESV